MPISPTTKARLTFIGNILLLLVFAISFPQSPLYTSNQNTYFVHGLADAGVGYLKLDWFAQTTDPFPVFSALVSATARTLGESAFYFLYMAILAIYLYAILGIVCSIHDMGCPWWGCCREPNAWREEDSPRSRLKYVAFAALLVVLYSGILVDPNPSLVNGLAGQFALGSFFQPATFGVLLILSIHLFMRDKPFAAAACLAIAASVHPSYLLSAAILTATCMAVTVARSGNYKRAILLGALALVLVLPIVIYVRLNFSPTSPDVFRRAQSILVDHEPLKGFAYLAGTSIHAHVHRWFNWVAVVRIGLIALSIYLVRRTPLFMLLLVPFLTSMALTLVQYLTGNRTLAMLFPWRVTAFLMPIASSIILAGLLVVSFRVFDRWIARIARPLHALCLVTIVLVGCLGVYRKAVLLNMPRQGLTPAVAQAAESYRPGELYMIPLAMQTFRLAANVPVLVDLKSHPYKDAEVIDWYERVMLAHRFYTSHGQVACELLQTAVDVYGVTHVVFRCGTSIPACDALTESYQDEKVSIYRVVGD